MNDYDMMWKWTTIAYYMGYDVTLYDTLQKFIETAKNDKNEISMNPEADGFVLRLDEDGSGDYIYIHFVNPHFEHDQPKMIGTETIDWANVKDNPGRTYYFENDTGLTTSHMISASKSAMTSVTKSDTTSFTHSVGSTFSVKGTVKDVVEIGFEVRYDLTWSTSETETEQHSETETTGDSVTVTLLPYSSVEVEVKEKSIPYTLNYDGSARLVYDVWIKGDIRDSDSAKSARDGDYCKIHDIGSSVMELGHTRGDRVGYDVFEHIKDIMSLYPRRGEATAKVDSFTWKDFDPGNDKWNTQANNLQAAFQSLLNTQQPVIKYDGKFNFVTIARSHEVKRSLPIYPLDVFKLEHDTLYISEGQSININYLKNLHLLTADEAGTAPYLNFPNLPTKWYLSDTNSLSEYDTGDSNAFFTGIMDTTDKAQVVEMNGQYYIKGVEEGETYLNLAVKYNYYDKATKNVINAVLTTADTNSSIKVVVIPKPEAPRVDRIVIPEKGSVPNRE